MERHSRKGLAASGVPNSGRPLTAGLRIGTVVPLSVGVFMSVRRCFVVIAMLVGFGLSAVPAKASNWLEMNFWMSGPNYRAKLPECDNGVALGIIRNRFQNKERDFWHSKLGVVQFANVQETGFRTWANDTIPRRFCSASVLLSDGVWRPVHYLIGEDFNLIGSTWDVEWCVVGVDRNWASNPACRMMRP